MRLRQMIAPQTMVRVTDQGRRGRFLRYRVNATDAVGVYVLDSQQTNALLAGAPWQPLQGHGRLLQHVGHFRLPYDDMWTVVIWNGSNHITNVDGEIVVE